MLSNRIYTTPNFNFELLMCSQIFIILVKFSLLDKDIEKWKKKKKVYKQMRSFCHMIYFFFPIGYQLFFAQWGHMPPIVSIYFDFKCFYKI